MLERQEVQEGGEPSCRSARCPRNLSLHFAAVGGKTGKLKSLNSPEYGIKISGKRVIIGMYIINRLVERG
jgi:hypothetical protein